LQKTCWPNLVETIWTLKNWPVSRKVDYLDQLVADFIATCSGN
jgi:hypothetical protein